MNKFIAEAERTFGVYEADLAASRAEVEVLLDVIADAAAALDRLGDRKMAAALMARWDAAMENGNV